MTTSTRPAPPATRPDGPGRSRRRRSSRPTSRSSTLYAVFSAYGLLNSYAALILSFTTFTFPLCVWTLKRSFDTIPAELIEA